MLETASAKAASPPLPRWSLALVCAVHAGVFGWAADVLPWKPSAPFTIAAAIIAGLHGLTGLLAALGVRARAAAWRALAAASLLFLAWCAWQVAATAVYVATLYGGLGRGIAVALAFAMAPLILFTLPVACWGLAHTQRCAATRRALLGAAALAVLTAAGLWRSGAAARAQPLPPEIGGPRALSALIESQLPDWRRLPAPASDTPPALDPSGPAHCQHPPTPDARRATVVVRYLAAGTDPVATRSRCLQGEADALAAELGALVRAEALRGPVKIDWIVAARTLAPRAPAVERLELRPGLDGVCLGGRCLMPWQLVLSDQFRAVAPLPFLRDLRFGFAPAAVRAELGGGSESRGGVRGLTGIAVASLVVDRDGRLRPLRRLREPSGALEASGLARALRNAESHIAGAQRDDGAFLYQRDPVSGRAVRRLIDLEHQAGATLAMCELGRDRGRVTQVARRSLAMLSRFEHRSGEISGLTRALRGVRTGLGETALPLIAFLTCRERVGDVHDELIARAGRLLLALQRPDGGFYRGFDLERAEIYPGPVPLYAAGQAVFALSLLEKRIAEAAAAGDAGPLPPLEQVRGAVERAMNHFAAGYWDHPLRDFFFIEESWHCMAARASLGHHRNEGYERFCLDYTAFRSRFLLDEGSGVSSDFVGGLGFGNLLPPHNVPTAGFGETLAAAMAIKTARGMDVAADRRLLARTLRFLVRQQWTAISCFACVRPERVVGGFSESMVSPRLRIDHAQHAWLALGHGAPLL